MKMIDYLRDKQMETPKYPVKSPEGEDTKFFRMLEYYSMTQGIYPTSLQIQYAPTDLDDNAVRLKSSLEVVTNEWVSFKLVRHGHYRNIRAFEVQLGEVQRVQIGWEYRPNRDDNTDKFEYGPSTGVGDVENTYAIDLSRSCYLWNGGNKRDVPGLELKEGTIIRSEKFGQKWWVDGKLVASTGDDAEGVVKIDTLQLTSGHPCSNEYLLPAISIKGSAKVTEIEYSD